MDYKKELIEMIKGIENPDLLIKIISFVKAWLE